VLSDLVTEPAPQWTPEDSQNGCGQQRCNGDEEEQESTELPAKKAGILRIVVDHVNALHQHSHHLRTSQKRSCPTNQCDFPSLGSTLDQELADNLLASWRQELRQVGDQVEQAGLSADAARRQCHDDQERWKKR